MLLAKVPEDASSISLIISPVRRLGSVAEDVALVAVAAEQSVAVSSSPLEMHRRCGGVALARQPQIPIPELEPKIMKRLLRWTNRYFVAKYEYFSPDSHTGRMRAAVPRVALSTRSSSAALAAPARRWPPR